jgi:hypothetical protein
MFSILYNYNIISEVTPVFHCNCYFWSTLFKYRIYAVSHDRMSIVQGRVIELSSSREVSINICPIALRYEDMEVVRVAVSDGTIVRITFFFSIGFYSPLSDLGLP